MTTETELPSVRGPEPLTITVLRLKSLRGQRGENLVAMIKLEWNDKTLGESTKVECTPEEPADINFTVNINVNFSDYQDLDDLAYKPVLVSVTEVLPKEKKQKDEKTNLLGQCTIDLFSMLTADATKNKQNLVIHPLIGSPLENLPADVPKPELEVQLSVNEALIPSAQAQESNLMSLTVESVYSPPETFQITGQPYIYVASLPLPVSAEKESTIVFGNGLMKPGLDKEMPNKQKRWLLPGISAQAPGSHYINHNLIASDPIDKEDGDYRGKEDREHRTSAEQDKNRITWNTERRSYLEAPACKSLQDKIARNRLWPVEVMRMPLPAGGKGKKDEENQVFYHGVAYVNLAPLLYPGVTRIKGAYKIHPYTDQDYAEKSKRKHGTADDALKVVHGQLNRGAASPFPKKGKDDKAKADAKKGSRGLNTPNPTASVLHMPAILQAPPASAQMRGADQVGDFEKSENTEGQQYVENKSYLTLEIKLARPMVPKRPPAEVARRVAEYIPPRPAFPKRTNGAQKAVEDFHSQVASVAELILNEFRDNEAFESLRKSLLENTGSIEEQRFALIYELNSSGKYFAFKEQLKHSVIKIVREKYLQTTSFKSQEELQLFLSELYVYLIDQMHVALSKYLSLEDKTPVPKPLTDTAQLKHFAQEAELNEEFDLAAKYYEERIARDPLNAEHWFDNGVFNLYINNKEKAEQCFKQCIGINQNHVNGLLMYGIVTAMDERVELAELCFEKATNCAPNSVIAWTMLSLFYDGIENEIGAEMAALEANRINVDNARRLQRAAALVQYETSVQTQATSEQVHDEKNTSVTASETVRLVNNEHDSREEIILVEQKFSPVIKDFTRASKLNNTHAQANPSVSTKPTSRGSKDKKAVNSGKRGILPTGISKPNNRTVSVDNTISVVISPLNQSNVSPTQSQSANVNIIAAIPVIPATRRKSHSVGTLSTMENGRRSGRRRESGSAAGSQMGSRTRSQESVNSLQRPPSNNKSVTTSPDHAEQAVEPKEHIRESTPIPEQTIYMQTIAWLLAVKATAFTEKALANQLIIATDGKHSSDSTPSAEYYIYMARLKLQKRELVDAEANLNLALEKDFQNPDAWAYMGHLEYICDERAKATDCYERTLSFINLPSETHSIYLRLASNYLLDGEHQKAKDTLLQACRTSPSCISWLGVGIACYRLDELMEAEDALSEANILNNEDPEVWGYLSMVCLRTGRQLEAEQAYKYALKLNLKDKELLAEVQQLQTQVGFGNPQL